MNFRVLPEADGEAIAAALWYDDQQSGLADEFFAEIEIAYASIMQNPLGLPRLEYGFEMIDVHRCLMHRFPYSVIYVCRPEEVVVVAIAHTRRQPMYWLNRLI